MSKVSIFLCSLLLIFGNISFADDAGAPLKKKKDARINILAMSTYKVLMGEDGFGGAKSLGDTAKAGDEKKEGEAKEEGEPKVEEEPGNFAAVNNAVFSNTAKELSGFRKWKFVSAADDPNKEALETFNKSVEAAIKELIGGENISSARWEMAPGLTYVPVQAATAMANKDYKKLLSAAIAQYCKDTGVDGVWIQENYLSYATTGGSAFLKGFTFGSGEAKAKASFIYALYDSGGNLIFDESPKPYESEDSFAMKFGVTSFNKNFEKLAIQAIEVGAKETVEELDDDL